MESKGNFPEEGKHIQISTQRCWRLGNHFKVEKWWELLPHSATCSREWFPMFDNDQTGINCSPKEKIVEGLDIKYIPDFPWCPQSLSVENEEKRTKLCPTEIPKNNSPSCRSHFTNPTVVMWIHLDILWSIKPHLTMQKACRNLKGRQDRLLLLRMYTTYPGSENGK